MTNPKYTDITIVLDRSGSMLDLWSDVLNGINSFVEDQSHLDGKVVLSLVTFDTEYDVIWNALNIQDVPKLTNKDIFPRGSTALLDAVGKRITDTGIRLAALSEDNRPNNVLFIVFTDGHENASREYTADQIRELIEQQTNTYKWTFSYLGSKHDAWNTAKTYGFQRSGTITAQASAVGYSDVLFRTSIATKSLHNNGTFNLNLTPNTSKN